MQEPIDLRFDRMKDYVRRAIDERMLMEGGRMIPIQLSMPKGLKGDLDHWAVGHEASTAHLIRVGLQAWKPFVLCAMPTSVEQLMRPVRLNNQRPGSMVREGAEGDSQDLADVELEHYLSTNLRRIAQSAGDIRFTTSLTLGQDKFVGVAADYFLMDRKELITNLFEMLRVP